MHVSQVYGTFLKSTLFFCMQRHTSHTPMNASHATNFESEDYWNARYRDPKQRKADLFDWYCVSFNTIRPHLKASLEDAVRRSDVSVALVDVGCGNSPFLWDAATFLLTSSDTDVASGSLQKRFVGTDFSDVVVSQQQQSSSSCLTHSSSLPVVFSVADARCGFGADICINSVGVMMDKATLDAVDCSGNEADAEAVVHQCLKHLVSGGVFVSLTCRPIARRVETIRSAVKSGGFLVADFVVESLKNDPIAPSHLVTVRKLS